MKQEWQDKKGSTDMNTITKEQLNAAASAFQFEGECISISWNTDGHINDTVVCTFREGDHERRYILQRINTQIMGDPGKLMGNIVRVTTFLKKKIREQGGDPDRETLTVIPARDGKAYFTDGQGSSWRAYDFIEDTICYDRPDQPDHFYQSALAFGRFQNLLADFPVETLSETIPGFHDTANRYRQFSKAVEEDAAGRKHLVRSEIEFLTAREAYTKSFDDRTDIPARVTHNDTKLSNVLFDGATGKALCVIDLDTVMPGLALHDFGDAIRFGASTATEDEPDLSKVSFDKKMYDLYLKGYLEECEERLTNREVELLPMGAKVITYEQALRFLADYLNGDIYYKTSRPEQNLDRARTQIKLLAEMEQQI